MPANIIFYDTKTAFVSLVMTGSFSSVCGELNFQYRKLELIYLLTPPTSPVKLQSCNPCPTTLPGDDGSSNHRLLYLI